MNQSIDIAEIYENSLSFKKEKRKEDRMETLEYNNSGMLHQISEKNENTNGETVNILNDKQTKLNSLKYKQISHSLNKNDNNKKIHSLKIDEEHTASELNNNNKLNKGNFYTLTKESVKQIDKNDKKDTVIQDNYQMISPMIIKDYKSKEISRNELIIRGISAKIDKNDRKETVKFDKKYGPLINLKKSLNNNGDGNDNTLPQINLNLSRNEKLDLSMNKSDISKTIDSLPKNINESIDNVKRNLFKNIKINRDDKYKLNISKNDLSPNRKTDKISQNIELKQAAKLEKEVNLSRSKLEASINEDEMRRKRDEILNVHYNLMTNVSYTIK